MSKQRKRVEVAYEADQEAARPLLEVGIRPEVGDNCAIARDVLEQGTRVKLPGGSVVSISHRILEGHRFAVEDIAPGQYLLSWGLMFGICSKPIAKGEYVCNEGVLYRLRERGIEGLPDEANFIDKILPYHVDEKTFAPSEQVPLYPPEAQGTFNGYPRSGGRGVGTRNYIAVIGTTSRTASFVRALAQRFSPETGRLVQFKNVDGVVPVAHTEGGQVGEDGGAPNNTELVLRTLSGFVVHPNVGAALLVDQGNEPIRNSMVQEYMVANGSPVHTQRVAFHTLTSDYEQDLKAAEELVLKWLDEVNQCERSPQSLKHLNVALQCGGSDAFSGVSGNPCAGWAAMELIQHGGKAVLAETDELMGAAETYVLKKVKNLETAQKFVTFAERFKYRFACHGQTCESNPSGGNNFRGLYNISLKSLGAAKKKHADVSLDAVVDYSEPITNRDRGYYFMDSPGNDLESIAGQVATGCNVIFFITGNGSITNFPFVPTVKILTTTRRYNLLHHDMDFNAGQYQDAGVPMDVLGRQLFDMMIDVSGGTRSKGELASHAQVSIWRNWRFNNLDTTKLDEHWDQEMSGNILPLAKAKSESEPEVHFQAYPTLTGFSVEKVGLILPTSLCSGQIALKIASQLNADLASARVLKEGNKRHKTGEDRPDEEEGMGLLAESIDRFVALPHTEGCGTGYSHNEEELYSRVMVGHLLHGSVARGGALLLEHGCEKTHNDYFSNALAKRKVSTTAFGWASVQLDGGIDAVSRKVREYFLKQAQASPAPKPSSVDATTLRVGVVCWEPLGGGVGACVAAVVRSLVAKGATVCIPHNSTLLQNPQILDDIMEQQSIKPSLAFGQQITQTHGVHIMDNPAAHHVETVTGMAASGVNVVLSFTSRRLQGHPMVPVVQVALPGSKFPTAHIQLKEGTESEAKLVVNGLFSKLNLESFQELCQGNVDFQITRGRTGCST